MSVIIKKVTSKDDLMKFIQFGIDLYKGNEYFVPPLIYDERATLNRSKNPASSLCNPGSITSIKFPFAVFKDSGLYNLFFQI
jgi:hypothetical protein